MRTIRQLSEKRSGFGALEVVVIIAIIVTVIGLVYYAVHSSRRATSPEANPATQLSPLASESPTPQVVKGGSFQNVGIKSGSGTVSIVKNSDGSHSIRLEDNFTVQDGPALYVAFGNGTTYAAGSNVAPLEKFSGSQEYQVPASLDINQYSSVVIWCEEFRVVFAAAALK